MSNFDLANDLKVILLDSNTITTDGTGFSSSFDIANFDPGFFVTAIAPAANYTDGTYTITLQDSPDDSVFTDVSAAKLNDPQGTGSIILSAGSADGVNQQRLGAFSVNQFIRVKIVATSVTSGAVLFMHAISKPENTPIA